MMFVRGFQRLSLVVGTLLTIAFFYFGLSGRESMPLRLVFCHWLSDTFSATPVSRLDEHSGPRPLHASKSPSDVDISSGSNPLTHRTIYSISNPSRKYFSLDFAPHMGSNPNIIPHPVLPSTWIIVAQQQRSSVKNTVWFAELVCNAMFTADNSSLRCLSPGPVTLPIAATSGDGCEGDLSYFSLNLGPHDARVFYGPRSPYALYGSQSGFTCFGQWMQDLRVLVDWGFEMFVPQEWRKPTELQRPPPYRAVEKNWFVFWDFEGQAYAHYDIAPSRVFTPLSIDGSIGQDLALAAAAAGDTLCLAKFMPQGEIHQASNSLSITLCEREHQDCRPIEDNTFIMMLFQQKTLHGFHSVYEPYVMLFRQRAPFEIYAISKKPFWIHGRNQNVDPMIKRSSPSHGGEAGDPDESEMLYVTSLSWKSQGQKYHGYASDELFIAFGIEDAAAGGIDIRAVDLLPDLAYCLTA